MAPLLLIQTGEVPETIRARFGGFADWFRRAMRLAPEQLHVVHVDQGEPLPDPGAVAGAVVTGSSAMVTDHADWSERTAGWIRSALGAVTPMFGVCYGHQLMADALGGKVGWLPAGREMGTTAITREPVHADGWLQPLPATFAAHTTHRQSVLEPPAGAQVLAHSAKDPNQLLRYGPMAYSSQFHPEFTAETMRAYVLARADALRAEGQDPEALAAGVRETEAARSLLQRFAQAVLDRRRVAA